MLCIGVKTKVARQQGRINNRIVELTILMIQLIVEFIIAKNRTPWPILPALFRNCRLPFRLFAEIHCQKGGAWIIIFVREYQSCIEYKEREWS